MVRLVDYYTLQAEDTSARPPSRSNPDPPRLSIYALSTMKFTLSLTIAFFAVGMKVAAQSCAADATFQCCETLAGADAPNVAAILQLIGVDPTDIVGLVGLTCTVPTGGDVCAPGEGGPACCTDEINIPLVPISISTGCT
ncbi:unnamed protein product [Peniophora sp. CBMAI 1063]|nr:unnamed protein product [Peniophora sp. CBMAI 1063]